MKTSKQLIESLDQEFIPHLRKTWDKEEFKYEEQFIRQLAIVIRNGIKENRHYNDALLTLARLIFERMQAHDSHRITS